MYGARSEDTLEHYQAILDLQHEHFGLAPLGDQLSTCHDDYKAIWLEGEHETSQDL